MSSPQRVIFIVSTDAALTQHLVSELVATGAQYQMPLAASPSQARQAFRDVPPAVILLDETALHTEKNSLGLESAAAMLTEFAPLVVVAAPERQAELAFLITSGAVDFVARAGDFVPLTVALLERRVRLAEQAGFAESALAFPEGVAADFGEILRHEVNNPLTGILGNAELLLAELAKQNGERQISEASVQRIQVIADLAVRLREIVRRLSNAWDNRHGPAPPLQQARHSR